MLIILTWPQQSTKPSTVYFRTQGSVWMYRSHTREAALPFSSRIIYSFTLEILTELQIHNTISKLLTSVLCSIFLEYPSLFLLLFLNTAQNVAEMIPFELHFSFVSLPSQLLCPIYCDTTYVYYNIYNFQV